MKKHESIRIFQNPLLESLDHVHPIIPLLLWSPVIIYLYVQSYYAHALGAASYAALFVAGMLTWTATEYLLHRFVFHFPATGPMGKRFVFLFHGLHHDDPSDATRLVMPPVPALLIAGTIYFSFSLVLPERLLGAFFASFMIGYLCYDYIHYATHHFAMTSKVGRYLKSYHLKHHHQHLPGRFGVSSPLWDILLGSR